MFNKKGQVSSTMTWVVATTAIIVVLILSILVVQFHFKNKKFENTKEDSDLLVIKSMTGYLKTGNAFSDLKNDGDFNNINGNLAKNVFEGLYSKEYPGFWMGIYDRDIARWIKNSYFSFANAPIPSSIINKIFEIKLDDKKSLGVVR